MVLSTSGAKIYDVSATDPTGRMFDRAHLSAADLDEIRSLMKAMGDLRDAEQKLSEASHAYMKLNATDMRAVRYLIVADNTDEVVTPGVLAAHLGISSASTTKMLDRLEAAGHIQRRPHPTDRRALAVTIDPQTKAVASDTFGHIHARRAVAAGRLTSEERAVVTRFLADVAEELRSADLPEPPSAESK